MTKWLFGSLALAILCSGALADGIPLPDVPRDHPCASAVAQLWRADVVRGRADGLFHGDERITETEAVVLMARVSAAVNNEYIIREDWSIDTYLARYWNEDQLAGGGVLPVPQSHWAAMEWNYLMWVLPPGAEALDGWPTPLPTRYEAASAAANTLIAALRKARRGLPAEYADTMLPDTAINEMYDLEVVPWQDHSQAHGDANEPPGPPPGMVPQ